MAYRHCTREHWFTATATATVEVDLAGYPHHLTLWPGWDTGPVTMDWDLVHVLLNGALRWHTDGVWREAAAPAALWYPAGTPVRIAVIPGQSPPTVRRLRWRVHRGTTTVVPAGGVIVCAHAGVVLPLLDFLAQESARSGDLIARRRRALVQAAASVLWDNDAPPPADAWARSGQDIERDVRRVLASDGLPPSPRDLARWSGLSPDYFTRCFRAHFGVSPRVWLGRQRMVEAARRLQASDAPVRQIAADLGFADARIFHRRFRAQFGLPPARWRRESGVVL